MNDTALALRELSHSYAGRQALTQVSLDIGAGVTALIGVNGAGKSTFLNIAAGGLRPSRGSVLINGDDAFKGGSRGRALRKVALMPQSATFPGSLTAREVVEYIAWMRGATGSTARALAEDALEQVGLSDRAGSKIRSLSGGMQRRVCLAQAIASEPEVLLLDEPSTGLDPEQRRTMVDLIRNLRGTVVLSSHVMEDVTELATRTIVLDAGSVAFDGSLTELTLLAPDPTSPRAPENGFLAVLSRGREEGR